MKEFCSTFSGLPVAPGNRATWDAQLLKIPAISPSIMNCCVIKVDYYVKVSEQAAKLLVQVNLDMTDSLGPGKLVRHMQNPSYT